MTLGTLIIVVGLPGAGKSTKLHEFRSSNTGLSIEDFHGNAFGDSPAVKDSRHYRALLEALRAGHSCVIADIEFCDPHRRDCLQQTIVAELPNVQIEWIYFENAPEKCDRNIRLRNRQRVDKDLRALVDVAGRYVIPDGVTPIPVWQTSR